MTEALKFTLDFPKFDVGPAAVVFGPGLHVIYGESGVGKSNLIRELIGLDSYGKNNFCLISKSIPDSTYAIFQNPDNQILCSTVGRELAFSLECLHNESEIIRNELEWLETLLPKTVGSSRHPATLSGGEKEILNLVVALTMHPKVLVIDDGLSFLSKHIKKQTIDHIFLSDVLNDSIIIWLTSDPEDLQFGISRKELTLSSFGSYERTNFNRLPQSPAGNGKLNLKCRDLSFGYENTDMIFTGLSLKTDPFRALGILGINGSGKTTLARIILKLLTPSAGYLEIASETGDQPLSIGYLDQFPERLIGYGSVDDFAQRLIDNNLLDPGRYRQCQRRAVKYQIQWGLVAFSDINTLSWSTLRFLLVLLLTHCKYNLLILDEPTFGLGWHQRIKLTDYLNEYLASNHLIVISHDRAFIDDLCDQKIDLNSVTSKTGRTVFDRIST